MRSLLQWHGPAVPMSAMVTMCVASRCDYAGHRMVTMANGETVTLVILRVSYSLLECSRKPFWGLSFETELVIIAEAWSCFFDDLIQDCPVLRRIIHTLRSVIRSVSSTSKVRESEIHARLPRLKVVQRKPERSVNKQINMRKLENLLTMLHLRNVLSLKFEEREYSLGFRVSKPAISKFLLELLLSISLPKVAQILQILQTRKQTAWPVFSLGCRRWPKALPEFTTASLGALFFRSNCLARGRSDIMNYTWLLLFIPRRLRLLARCCRLCLVHTHLEQPAQSSERASVETFSLTRHWS